MVSPVTLMLGYSSYQTTALIGPLEIWEGVEPDVDWNAIEPPGGTGGRSRP